MINCCFLVNNAAFNFVIIAIVFVLHETIIILELFSCANINNFVVMNISPKSLSNLDKIVRI